MLNVFITLQIIVTLICLASVLVVAFQKTSSYSNIIVITFVCAFVQCGGYVLELSSKNVFEGMMAVKTEYLGGAFEICLLTFFIFKYCGHEFNLWMKSALIFEGGIVLFGVWSWEYTHLYYTGVEFVETGLIPHLVMQHGILYYAFALTTVAELLGCIFILAVSILKTNQKNMKYNYSVLIIVVIVPFLGFLLSISGIFDGYDATPIGAGISVGIFAFAVAGKHVFDVADAAGEIILSNMENAIIVKNSDDGYEYSNKKAEELFPVLKSYGRGEIINDVEVKKIFDTSRDNGITVGKRHFDINIHRVFGNESETIGTIAVLFDVTDSREKIEQMKALMEEARTANKSKTTFLANISHEIRTPINIIMGTSEIMLRDYATEETEEYLLNIRNSSNTLSNLINDIIDFARIETGKMKIDETKFDMKKFMTEIISIYEFRCGQKDISFTYEVAEDIPKYVVGDVLKIKQIANILLSNAVKYTDEGGVILKFGYKLRSDFDIDLIMAVEDTGIGINRDDFDKVLSGSVLMDASDNVPAEESGLRLSIAKQMVELLGGIINFRSEVGKGTVFSVVIPVRISPDSTETIESVVGKVTKDEIFRTQFTCPKAKILVVDDSKINLMVTKELLKDTKATVVTANSGEESLELVSNTYFDIIFMDHRMPKMNGIEALSRIRNSSNKCQHVPVIVYTANASTNSRESYLAKGFTDFLAKPSSLEQISTILYKYLPENYIEKNKEV